MRGAPSAFGREETLRGGQQPSAKLAATSHVDRRVIIKASAAALLGGFIFTGKKGYEAYERHILVQQIEHARNTFQSDGVSVWEYTHEGISKEIVILVPLPHYQESQSAIWKAHAKQKLQWLQERFMSVYEIEPRILVQTEQENRYFDMHGIGLEEINRFSRHVGHFHDLPYHSSQSPHAQEYACFDALTAASPHETDRTDIPSLVVYEESMDGRSIPLDHIAAQWNREQIGANKETLQILRLEFPKMFHPAKGFPDQVAER